MTNRLWMIAGLALCLGSCSEDAPMPLERPNIILITIDALRADRLGAYGGNPEISPAIDALAHDGVLFEKALAPIATTFPSHATMLTGLYPAQHGVRWNGQSLAEDFVSLPEVLAEEGYDRAAFTAYRAMLSRGGLNQGFATVSDPPGTKTRGAIIRSGADTVALAEEWLQARTGDEPFMLWVHMFEPHTPYEPTPYSEARLRDYDGIIKKGLDTPDVHRVRKQLQENPEDLAALHALYDGEIAQADALVGRLLSALEQTGELDSSVVIVTGDHGEGMGEGGRFGHGPTLADSILHVPLVIRDYRTAPLGHRVGELVGLADLMDTVLDLVGVSQRPPTQGRTLLPALIGKDLEPSIYFAEVRSQDVRKAGRDYDPEQLAVYSWPFKLVLANGTTVLYDLESDFYDPEFADAEQNPGVAESLEAFAAELRSGEMLSSTPADLDDETLEELRSLGYIQ